MLDALLNSYSQIFFLQHRFLSVMVLLVSFFEPQVGFFGFISVLIAVGLAKVMGYDAAEIRTGILCFNSLLVGLGIGKLFVFNDALILFLITGSVLSLFITLVTKGFFKTFGLPFLALPFVICMSILAFAVASFPSLQWKIEPLFQSADVIAQQQTLGYQFRHLIPSNWLPSAIETYFRSLSNLFFIDSVLGGIFIALGLVWASRIAFSLSIIGLASAYFWLWIFGIDNTALTYYLQGINFILFAIGFGGFFYLPDKSTYLGVFFGSPLVLMVIFLLNKVFFILQIAPYSLAFSVSLIGVIFALSLRTQIPFFYPIAKSIMQPESHLYEALQRRKVPLPQLPVMQLPFLGRWMVSQGYEGSTTHLGDWGKALDFVVLDQEMKTYRLPGKSVSDFYTFNKPVLAPADGYIYDLISDTEENPINEVNTDRNWGNSIVINHGNGKFSQISHLKKDSISVKIGAYVARGLMIAKCGNSGRSPEPHLHFQVQEIPIIGAKTIAHPLSYFIASTHQESQFIEQGIPEVGTFVENVSANPFLFDAFDFNPQKSISVVNQMDGATLEWIVLTDEFNQKYIRCATSNSIAYFINDGIVFRFTKFDGQKQSLLFQFFTACQKVLLGLYPQVHLQQALDSRLYTPKSIHWIQDFCAPFYLIGDYQYESAFDYANHEYHPTEVQINVNIKTKRLNKVVKIDSAQILVQKQCIQISTPKHNFSINCIQ